MTWAGKLIPVDNCRWTLAVRQWRSFDVAVTDRFAGHDNNGHVAAPGIDDHAVQKSALVLSSNLGTGDRAQQHVLSPLEHRLYAIAGDDCFPYGTA